MRGLIHIPPITFLTLALLCLIEPTPYLAQMLAAALLHEAGHLAAIGLCGAGVKRITVLPFGIDIERKTKILPLQREFFISLSGPLVNLWTFALICLFGGTPGFFAFSNLFLAVFNLLPIKSLDGGEAFYTLLLKLTHPYKASRIANAVSIFFIILIWIAGSYILLFLNGNLSVFALAVFLFICTIK